MTSWTPVEQAIISWVRQATGLDDQSVIIAEQNGLSPAATKACAVTIKLGDSRAIGVDSQEQVAVDTVGRNITMQATGSREMIVEMRGFGSSVTGDTSARALLELVRSWAPFDSVRDVLNAAGLGLLDLGTVQHLPKVVNAGWESQAFFEARFCVLVTPQQTVPYIAKVNGELEITSVDGETTEEVPFTATLP